MTVLNEKKTKKRKEKKTHTHNATHQKTIQFHISGKRREKRNSSEKEKGTAT